MAAGRRRAPRVLVGASGWAPWLRPGRNLPRDCPAEPARDRRAGRAVSTNLRQATPASDDARPSPSGQRRCPASDDARPSPSGSPGPASPHDAARTTGRKRPGRTAPAGGQHPSPRKAARPHRTRRRPAPESPEGAPAARSCPFSAHRVSFQHRNRDEAPAKSLKTYTMSIPPVSDPGSRCASSRDGSLQEYTRLIGGPEAQLGSGGHGRSFSS
jgi:hypothetical protein